MQKNALHFTELFSFELKRDCCKRGRQRVRECVWLNAREKMRDTAEGTRDRERETVLERESEEESVCG